MKFSAIIYTISGTEKNFSFNAKSLKSAKIKASKLANDKMASIELFSDKGSLIAFKGLQSYESTIAKWE